MNVEQILRGIEPDWPETPDLAAAVAPRLGAREARRGPVRRRPLLAIALASLLLAGAAVAAVPAVREWFFGGDVEVERVPALPRPDTGALDLGPRVTLAQARERAGFEPLYPRAFRSPRFHAQRGRFAAVAGGLLFTAFRGDVPRPLIRKLVAGGTTVLPVKDTLWIEGRPHLFLYRAPGGIFREERVRLAGNVYLWQRGPLLLRLEGARTRREAIRLAATVR